MQGMLKRTWGVLAGASALALVLGSQGVAGAAPAVQTTPVPVDVSLVIDGSASISIPNFELMRYFARQLATSCIVGTDAEVGAVQFSDQGATRLEINLTKDLTDVNQALVNMPQIAGNTDIEEGLKVSQDMLGGGRSGVRKIAILMTDGEQNEPGDPGLQADAMRSAGTEVFVVGVGTSLNDAQLTAIANNPDSTYLYYAPTFGSLANVLKSLLQASCGVAPVTPPTLTPTITKKPDVTVTMKSDPPNGATTPGATTTLTIVATNRGKSNSDDTTIRLPLDPAQLKVTDVQTSRQQTWVSKSTPDLLEIKTGPLNGLGDVVTSTVQLETQNLPNGTTIRLQLETDTTYAGGHILRTSNSVTLVVGGSATVNATLNAVPSSAVAGETITFSSDAFMGSEPVSVWYNTPSGGVVSRGLYNTDPNGLLSFTFSTTGMAPGFYSMVARGNYSTIQVVVAFEVK